MFNLESRKQNTKNIINFLKKLLYSLHPNHEINGLLVLILHWCFVGIPMLGLIIFKLDWKFYISAIIWVLICIFHIYFNGCICTRLERELWNTKDWYGPWLVPFKLLESLGIPITYGLTHNIFICWGIALIIWILIRIIFQDN